MLCLYFAFPVKSQTATSSSLQFEVASIRENRSQSDSSDISTGSSARLVITNVPLRFIVLYAYDLPDHQLAGMPAWTQDRSFDIQAVYPEAERPDDKEIRAMLQQLLSSRFNLQLHHEQKELAAYDLEKAGADERTGLQRKKVEDHCSSSLEASPAAGGAPAGTGGAKSPSSRSPACSITATRRQLWGDAATMHDLANTLQAMVGRPVIDKTGLPGRYDLALHWSPMQLHADHIRDGGSADEYASLFSALQDQLGLKLVSRKESFDVLVVDTVSMPNQN